MNNLPKITVITATFNLIKDGREKFFRQAVESVHNQTYGNIEHIVMDGASTDGTSELIKEYENKGWIKYYSKADAGMWEGMNNGIKKATGKYICFLNSDDFYTTNDVLELSIKKLEETHADYCFGWFDVIEKENDKLIFHGKFLPIEYFFTSMTYNHETLICKKSVYEELGYHNEEYKTTIDYAFNISLILNDYKYTKIDKTIVTVRTGGGTSGNEGGFCSEQTVKNICKLYKDVFDFYPLNEDFCKKMFLKHIFPTNFLTILKRDMFARGLKNFNYLFFTDCVNELQKDNDKKYNNLHIVDKKSKTKINLFGIIRFNVIKTINKTKYCIFYIPLITKINKDDKVLYKLFNIIPFLKIKY